MTQSQTIHKLIKRAVAQRIPPRTFTSHIQEVEKLNAIPDNQYTEQILTIHTASPDYQIQLVVAQAFTSPELLERFWRCLGSLPPQIQMEYMAKVASATNTTTIEMIGAFVSDAFKKYLSACIDAAKKTDERKIDSDLDKTNGNIDSNGKTNSDLISMENPSVSLLFKLVFLTAHFAHKYPHVAAQHEEFFAALVHKLAEFPRLAQFLYGKIDGVLSSSATRLLGGVARDVSHDVATEIVETPGVAYTTSFQSYLPKNLLIRGKQYYETMKRYLWMDSRMRTWDVDEATFVGHFSAMFVEEKHSTEAVAHELISASLVGMAYAARNNPEPYVLFNWKNFVVARVAHFLAALKPTGLEDTLEGVLNSLSNDIRTDVRAVRMGKDVLDVEQGLVKSLVLHKVVSPAVWARMYPQMPGIQSEIAQFGTDLHLSSKFNEKLLHLNLEFTSLEESGLGEFVNLLPAMLEYSYARQHEFAAVVERILTNLMAQRDSERLHRLLLVLLNNVRLVNMVVADLSPIGVICKMADYVDTQTFSADDNDENFQEHYLYFGVVVLGIVLIADKFGVDLSRVQMRGSFAVDFVNGFYYRLGENLTSQVDMASDEDQTVVSNYNGLLADWINALFDDNNDGLSDELVKLAGIKQIYKMIPLIYKQLVAAAQAGTISFEILATGIDYLSQVFLIPCTASIVSWLLGKVSASDDFYARVLSEIIRSNAGDLSHAMDDDKKDAPALIFLIVLQICGDRIINVLPDSTLAKYVETRIDLLYVHRDTTDQDPKGTDTKSKEANTKDAGIVNKGIRELFREYLVYGPRAGVPHYLEVFMRNPRKLVDVLLVEIAKNNSEETLLVLNVGAYMCVVAARDKQHWRQVLRGRAVRGQGDVATTGAHTMLKFLLTIANHYASIFEDNSPPPAEGMDAMLIDDSIGDDLFGEPAEDFKLGESRKNKGTSTVLRELYDKSMEQNSVILVWQRDDTVSRPQRVLRESLLYGLDWV